jgi:hypothetical protein
MNKKTVIASLNDIANELESTGLFKEAGTVTDIMVKLSQLPPGAVRNTSFPGAYTLPGKVQPTQITGEERKEIENLLARAGQITHSQTSQFNDKGTGKVDESPGWDFINGQVNNKVLSPEAFKQLKREWASLAEGKDGWAGRKQPKKTDIRTPGVHNVDQDKVKNEAWKLVHEALEDKSGDAWTNFKDKLHSNPIFNGNPNGQEFAKRLFYYQLESKGKNPSLKPIQDQSLGK